MALTRLNNRSVSAVTALPSASTSSFLTAMPNGTVVQVKTAFSNTTQSFDLFKNQLIMVPVGPNTQIWFKVTSSTGSVAFGELS